MKMSINFLLLSFSCLASCGAQPSPAMYGGERTEVMRDGRQYVLFLKENKVEVIRLGYATRGEHAGIRQTMVALIPEITGCVVNEGSIQGDSGLIRGTVSCAS